MSENVYRFLEETASRMPNAPAVVASGRTTTFAQLRERSDALRSALLATLGEQRTVVGYLCANSAEFVAGLFAIFGAGKVAAPISPQARIDECSELVEALHLSHLIVHRDLLSHVPKHWLGVALGDSPFVLFHPPGAANLASSARGAAHVPNAAAIRPTSGTTGKSKGVILSHETIAARTAAAQDALALAPGERVCWVLPMAYHFVVSVVMYVRYGAVTVIVPDQLGETMLRTLIDERCTVLYGTPLHYSLLAQTPGEGRIPHLRLPISTASPLSSAIAQRFESRFGIRVRQAYGIIELGLPLGNLDGDPFEAHSLGRPLPGFEAELRAPSGPVLGTHESGDLYLRGPGMFDGYLEPPITREQLLEDGWFATGDVAYRGPSGEIFVAGRKKSVIITAGNKVFPEEVEAVLELCPGVARSRVFAKPHDLFGEIVVAELELEPGAEFRPDEILRTCTKRLTNFKVPQELTLTERVPLTGSGKVSRA